MGTSGPKKMLERAMDVAAFLLRDPRIAKVYLFGSLARDGDGRDIDLIVVPKDPQLARAFLDQLNEQIGEMEPDDCYFGGPEVRFGIFFSLFSSNAQGFGSSLYTLLRGEDEKAERPPSWLLNLLPAFTVSKLLDIFVLPADWRTSELVTTSLRTRDPYFLKNVARDAVRFDSETGSFTFSSWQRNVVFPRHRLWRNYLSFEWRGARSKWLILSGILNQLEFIRRQRLFERDQASYRAHLAVMLANAARRQPHRRSEFGATPGIQSSSWPASPKLQRGELVQDLQILESLTPCLPAGRPRMTEWFSCA